MKTFLSNVRQVVGYVRVSTDEQSLSVEAQHQALERWCQAHQVDLVAVYEDVGVHGDTPLEKRAGLLAALNTLRRGMALLVVKRDRLARDTFTAVLCEKLAQRAKAAILSVNSEGNGDGPQDLLMRRMLDAIAEYERLVIALRTKTALAHKRGKGERVGMVPYGKRLAADGVHLHDEPSEQAVMAIVHELRASGLSYRAIAAELNRRGLTNRAGGRFMPTQVVRMLTEAA
jgi:site-specific DNA recombinase